MKCDMFRAFVLRQEALAGRKPVIYTRPIASSPPPPASDAEGPAPSPPSPARQGTLAERQGTLAERQGDDQLE